MASYSGSFDHGRAMELFSNDEKLLKELAVMFVEKAPRQLANARNAIAEAKIEQLTMAAHHLRGDLGLFAAYKAHEQAGELENAALRGDIELLEPLLRQLETETEAVCKAMRRAFGI